MRVLAFDTETYLITARDKAPKPVIATWSDGITKWYTAPNDPQLLAAFADPETHIVGHNIAYDMVVLMRWHPETIPVIVQAYLERRIWDTQIRHQLLYLEKIGGAGYKQFVGLSTLEQFMLKVDRSAQKKGEDIWRLKYGTLDGVPYEQWPAEAMQYALDDAFYCHQVFTAQGGVVGVMPTEDIQVRAALSLFLATVWGAKTDQANVAKIEADLLQKMSVLQQQLDNFHMEIDGKRVGLVGTGSALAIQKLVKEGWHKFIPAKVQELAQQHGVTVLWDKLTGMRDDIDIGHLLATNEKKNGGPSTCTIDFCYDSRMWNPPEFIAALRAAVSPIPHSSKGFKTGENDIEPIIGYVPILKTRADFKHLEKMYGTYITPYKDKETIHANYSTLVSTGRTASDSVNVQNIPRSGGFRDNLHAREGYLFGTVDYAALEMVTLAATLVHRMCPDGVDKEHPLPPLAKAINDGMDLHCMTASKLFGEQYETFVEVVKAEKKAKKADPHAPAPYSNRRQGSKALNFGASGGLGATAFQIYAKHQYGVEWTLTECRKRIRDWKAAWPDIKSYLRNNGDDVDANQETRMAQAVNNLGRRKANCIYTQLCNYPFQSLAADGAKMALWELILHQLLGWFWTEAHSDLHQKAFLVLGQRCEQQARNYYCSPLRRSHVAIFIHDEIVQEHPVDLAEEAFELQQKIMTSAMEQVTSGVKVGVEGQLGPNWAH